MVEQILLSSSSFAGVREIGGFGQPLHALYPQIQAVLTSELGPEAADLLAEPVVDRAHNRIDWYAKGDPDRPTVALSELPEEQRQPLLAQIHDMLDRGREVAERYAASDDPRRARLGAMLGAALGVPEETGVFLVEGRPIIVGWGFGPDRPWETLTDAIHSPSTLIAPPRDMAAMPEIAMPELTTAAPDQESVIESLPLVPALEPVPAEPLPESPPVLPPESASTPTASEPAAEAPPESKPAPVATGFEPSLEPEPDSRWRYVVVGSRYFWSVFALAVLLAVVAAVWVGMGKPSPSAGAGQAMPALAADAELDRALTGAQRAETELRTRLEDLLAQLAGRRGQCPSPAAGSDAGASPPTVREPGDRGPASTRAVVAVAAGERSGEPALKAPAADRVIVAPEQSRGADSMIASPGEAQAVPATAASAPADHAMPAAATSSTPNGASFPDSASPRSAPPSSRAPAGTESPVRALEDVLVGRAPAPPAPLRQPSSVEAELPLKAESPDPVQPPVKAEPTAEERREFASRLSAAGAATGEITVTLLWNSPGDLDLVVRCPSGQQLDYRNPAACGGALDVDANAARASLSDRPVENAFWRAGQAAPGSYQVVVRYAPRKDERNPRETPFQVRLIRGGQESVFKGAIRPHAVTPVTTFIVER
jgi:hypothetical protein